MQEVTCPAVLLLTTITLHGLKLSQTNQVCEFRHANQSWLRTRAVRFYSIVLIRSQSHRYTPGFRICSVNGEIVSGVYGTSWACSVFLTP